MKIVDPENELSPGLSTRQTLDMARNLEAEGAHEKAVKIYSALLKKQPLNEHAYNRLMILHRKVKDYRKEILLIEQAIDKFESGINNAQKLPTGRIGKLSLSLGRLTGLIDKKGKSLYDPEPVATWKKRKLLAQKRLKSQKK